MPHLLLDEFVLGLVLSLIIAPAMLVAASIARRVKRAAREKSEHEKRLDRIVAIYAFIHVTERLCERRFDQTRYDLAKGNNIDRLPY